MTKITEFQTKLSDENKYLRSIVLRLKLSDQCFVDIKEELDLEIDSSGQIYDPTNNLVFDNLLLEDVEGFTLVCIGVLTTETIPRLSFLREDNIKDLDALNMQLRERASRFSTFQR